MVRERADAGDVYRSVRAVFCELVHRRPATDLARAVSASPQWTVHDVLAHVVGLVADLNAARFPTDGAGDAWTAQQVESRRPRTRTRDELCAEWEREAPAFEAGLRLFGYETGCHFVADLVVHLHDVQEALGEEPSKDPVVLAVALDHYCGFLTEAMGNMGTVCVRAGTDEWLVGAGPTFAEVDAPAYDLLRCLSARRSRREMEALPWRGEAGVFLDGFEAALPGSYSLPASPQ